MSKLKIKDARKKVTTEIETTERLFLENTDSLYGEYLRKFIICEKACKIILYKYYKYTKGTTIPIKEIELVYKDIVKAIKLYQYNIESNVLLVLFSQEKTKGKKSAKILRNELVHDYHQDVLKEIIQRKEYLYEMMQRFLFGLKEEYKIETKK